MKQLLIILGILIGFISCNTQESQGKQERDNSQVEQKEQNVLKVYVGENGEIFANDNKISLEDLDKEFNELKIKDGMVYYSRPHTTDDPPEESMKVMQLMVQYELPIKFFTDKTFKTPVKMR